MVGRFRRAAGKHQENGHQAAGPLLLAFHDIEAGLYPSMRRPGWPAMTIFQLAGRPHKHLVGIVVKC
jgi:hypothetical protein